MASLSGRVLSAEAVVSVRERGCAVALCAGIADGRQDAALSGRALPLTYMQLLAGHSISKQALHTHLRKQTHVQGLPRDMDGV